MYTDIIHSTFIVHVILLGGVHNILVGAAEWKVKNSWDPNQCVLPFISGDIRSSIFTFYRGQNYVSHSFSATAVALLVICFEYCHFFQSDLLFLPKVVNGVICGRFLVSFFPLPQCVVAMLQTCACSPWK